MSKIITIKLQNGRHNTQHDDTQHNDTQHNDTQHNWLIFDTEHKRHSA